MTSLPPIRFLVYASSNKISQKSLRPPTLKSISLCLDFCLYAAHTMFIGQLVSFLSISWYFFSPCICIQTILNTFYPFYFNAHIFMDRIFSPSLSFVLCIPTCLQHPIRHSPAHRISRVLCSTYLSHYHSHHPCSSSVFVNSIFHISHSHSCVASLLWIQLGFSAERFLFPQFLKVACFTKKKESTDDSQMKLPICTVNTRCRTVVHLKACIWYIKCEHW